MNILNLDIVSVIYSLSQVRLIMFSSSQLHFLFIKSSILLWACSDKSLTISDRNTLLPEFYALRYVSDRLH